MGSVRKMIQIIRISVNGCVGIQLAEILSGYMIVNGLSSNSVTESQKVANGAGDLFMQLICALKTKQGINVPGQWYICGPSSSGEFMDFVYRIYVVESTDPYSKPAGSVQIEVFTGDKKIFNGTPEELKTYVGKTPVQIN